VVVVVVVVTAAEGFMSHERKGTIDHIARSYWRCAVS